MNSLRVPGSSPRSVNGEVPAKTRTGARPRGRVGDGAAHVLGAAVHVHDHGARLAGDQGVGVRGAQRHHLVRADDQLRQFALAALGAGLGHGLDDAGVIAAEVGEDVGDARLRQRLKERGARRVVALAHLRGPPASGYPHIVPTGSRHG